MLKSHRHASIDAATRAARGLPEDLIRLCVGIEDSNDLLEDLECALIEAGALAFNAQENKYTRVVPVDDDTLSRAVQKLALDEGAVPDEQTEWFVSAPGKVILFGEHAVVHGVVSSYASGLMVMLIGLLLDCYCGISGPSLLWTNGGTLGQKDFRTLRRF